jgi:aspartyl-tRNA(Asn)/glutamyl-tRNA(Gln) amidotransferase subunit C
MKVSESDVDYVAGLANLDLTRAERDRMLQDLNAILNYVDRLNELDTSNVPPMAQVADRFGVDASRQGSERFAYATRDDVHNGLRVSLPQNEALANAPDSNGTFFRVPKVIER